MIREAIGSLVNEGRLDEAAAIGAAEEIFSGEATPAQIASFLTALRMRGERVEHIRAFAQVMRDKAAPVRLPGGEALDIVGTGGDGAGTFNISTASALIAASAGVAVAKHGNRGASSPCGSADALEALGVRIDLTPDQAGQCLAETGMCFMFAPTHHSGMRFAGPVRKEIGVRTIFNYIGPLSNPARATHYVLGVFDENLTEMYAQALDGLGARRAIVAHGRDGLDELTTADKTKISELRDGRIETREIDPADFGIARAAVAALRGDPAVNREILLDILHGRDTGPRADIVALNAGAALYVAGKAESIGDGIALSRELIATGKAIAKLDQLRECTARLAGSGK